MTGKKIQTLDGGPAPVKFEPPALQTFERFSSDLTSFDVDTLDARGMPVVRPYPLPEINKNSQLIPESSCRDIVAELEVALFPADEGQAHELVRRVLGRYAKRDLVDPDMFVTEMKRVFAEAPPDLGAAAVDKLRGNRFMPNVGDLTAALEPLVEGRRRELGQVRRHLGEHERRRGMAAPPGELSEKISWFKGLGPAVKKAVGDELFKIFWPTLWLFSDDGARMVLAQPTLMLRDLTAPHSKAIGTVANREVELVVKTKPHIGSLKPRPGPRPIGDIVKGD